MIYLVRFDSLLDAYVRSVFSDLDGGFFKNSSGQYVCGKDIFGSSGFGRNLEKYVLGRIGGKRDGYVMDYFFILGDCHPSDNFFLDFQHFASPVTEWPYRLAESDIRIDTASFNKRALSVFDRLFTRKAAVSNNVFAVRHGRLSAETLRAFLKCIFGAVNCRDMDREVLFNLPRCIVSENDIVENGVKDKSKINSAPETALIIKSLKLYVGECIGREWSI